MSEALVVSAPELLQDPESHVLIEQVTSKEILQTSETELLTESVTERELLEVAQPELLVETRVVRELLEQGSAGGGIESVNGDTGPAVSLNTDEVPEGAANLYHTAARVRATDLTGLAAGAAAAIAATDTILQAFAKAQAQIDGKEAAGTAAGLVAAHEAAPDPHSQYATDAALAAGLAGKENTGVAAAAVAAHESAPDPHPQYLTPAEGDAAYTPVAHAGAGGAAHANAVAAGAAGFMSGADKSKLDGIAVGATANSPDATLLDRANHTGTQLAATISDFAATVRATVLTGLDTATAGVVAATDTVLSAIGKLVANLAAHIGNTSNPHSVTAAQAGADPAGTAASAVAAHEALADPHTQYLTAAEGNAAYQPVDATLTALAGQDWAANAIPVGTGANTLTQVALAANTMLARSSAGNVAAKPVTDFALSLVDDADAAAARSTLNLGTLATQNGTFSGTSSGTNTGDETAASIGTLIAGATAKATPVDADSLGLSDSAGSNVLKKTTWANVKATLKTYFDTLYHIVGGTDVPVADGGTGASTASAARTNLGLGYLIEPLMDWGGKNFNGTTTYLNGSALTGIADGKLGSLFVVVRFANAASAAQFIFASTGAAFALQRTAVGNISILGNSTAPASILNITTGGRPCASAGTYTIMASWDLGTPGSGRIYVNDVSDFFQTTYTDAAIDYTVAQWGVGAGPTGASPMAGDFYTLWFDPTQRLEFATESVRRRFIDANLVPVFLGGAGELPTGTAPGLFLAYDGISNWHTNRGTFGGTFTQNGANADAVVALEGQFGSVADYSRSVALRGALTVPGPLTVSGGQIAFPATQSASADANTLDDYEEGSFTPGLTFGGASAGMTFSLQAGTYTKVGNRVDFSLALTLSDKGTSTGIAYITGLPFTVAASPVGFPVSVVMAAFTSGIATNGLYAQAVGSAATVRLDKGSTTTSTTQLTNTDFTNTTLLRVNGTYNVA